MSETYEILALKYATHANRTRFDNFMSADDHASPQPIDYFVWVIRNANRTILVDTGFDHAEAKSRARVLTFEPQEVLKRIGIDADAATVVALAAGFSMRMLAVRLGWKMRTFGAADVGH